MPYDNYKKLINYNIVEYIISNYPIKIQEHLTHILGNGKRLRPILSLIFSGNKYEKLNNEPLNNSLKIAILVEIIHCISLVLDDLPEMDNDDFRRDNLSFHKKYGVHKSNFISYYLINKVFFELANIFEEVTNDNKIHDLIFSNINKLISGQYHDLNLNNESDKINDGKEGNNDNDNNNKHKFKTNNSDSSITKVFDKSNNINKQMNTLINPTCKIIARFIPNVISVHKLELLYDNINLNLKKTSSLFNFAVITNLYYYNYCHNNIINKSTFEKLNIWCNVFGIIFQFSDDILDLEQDIQNKSPNICRIISKEEVVSVVNSGIIYLQQELNLIIETNPDLYLNLDLINEILMLIKNRCN